MGSASMATITSLAYLPCVTTPTSVIQTTKHLSCDDYRIINVDSLVNQERNLIDLVWTRPEATRRRFDAIPN